MSKFKVLIVEDEFVFYDKLAEFFTDKGFEVLSDSKVSFVNDYERAIMLAKNNIPDIAILDIDLKQEKDGIDIGIWLKEHFNVPVVFLSSKDNYSNLQKLIPYPEMDFMVKASSEANLRELWFKVQRVLAQPPQWKSNPEDGKFLSLRKLTLHDFGVLTKKNYESIHGNHQERMVFLKFSSIREITAVNEKLGWGKNISMLLDIDGEHCYIIGGSLNNMEEIFPWHFVRISGSRIINGSLVTSPGKTDGIVYMGDQRFEVSKDFNGTELAYHKLAQLIKRRMIR